VPEQLEKRMENCLVEGQPENAVGLGIELSSEPENWPKIMDIASANYRRYHRSQLPLFLKYLGVEDFEPIFKEMGFDPAKHNLKREDFEAFARQSRKLRFMRLWFF
jgi:hypothetical protein